MTEPIRGTAAGVPYLAFPPRSSSPGTPVPPDTPVVVLWHLLAPPSSPEAFAAALPLAGLSAWRVYLEVPMTGARLPAGGVAEIGQRAREDFVLQLHAPITRQGAAEFPAALAEVRAQLGAPSGPVALVGGSQGSAIAAQVALDTTREAPGTLAGLVLLSPVIQLRSVVDALAEQFGTPYTWGPESAAIAEQMDLVARAGELTTPLQIVVGTEDDTAGFVLPARRLHDRLPDSELLEVEGMGHALAEGPGDQPTPQTPYAVEVDRAVSTWLRRVLHDGPEVPPTPAG